MAGYRGCYCSSSSLDRQLLWFYFEILSKLIHYKSLRTIRNNQAINLFRYFSISHYHSCSGTGCRCSNYQHGPVQIELNCSNFDDLILTFCEAMRKQAQYGLTVLMSVVWLVACRANLNSFMLFLLIYWLCYMSQMELLTAHSHFYLLLLFESFSQFTLQFYFSSRDSILQKVLYCILYSFYTDTFNNYFRVYTLARAGLPSPQPNTNSYFYSIQFQSACIPSNCDNPQDRLLINEQCCNSCSCYKCGDFSYEQLTCQLLSWFIYGDWLMAITERVRLSCIYISLTFYFFRSLFSSYKRVMMLKDYSSALCCFSKSVSIFLKYSDCYLYKLQIIASFSYIRIISSLFSSSRKFNSRPIISIVCFISLYISCCYDSYRLRNLTFQANY